MEINTAPSNQKSSLKFNHNFGAPPGSLPHSDEILRVLKRSRRNAVRLKKLYLAENCESAEGLLVSCLDFSLGMIERGKVVRFEDWLRFVRVFGEIR